VSDEKVIIDIDEVFEVCNASLRAARKEDCFLPAPTIEDCLICRNAKCFDAFKKQNKLWGITDKQSVRELRDIQGLECKPCVVVTVPKQTVRSDGPMKGRLF
jgi:hypothetical protein